MTGIDLPLTRRPRRTLPPRRTAYRWLDYIRNSALDVPTVSRFAGLIAVTRACSTITAGSILPIRKSARPSRRR